jgi:hypothetical protein
MVALVLVLTQVQAWPPPLLVLLLLMMMMLMMVALVLVLTQAQAWPPLLVLLLLMMMMLMMVALVLVLTQVQAWPLDTEDIRQRWNNLELPPLSLIPHHLVGANRVDLRKIYDIIVTTAARARRTHGGGLTQRSALALTKDDYMYVAEI